MLDALAERGHAIMEESARSIIAERRARGLSPRPDPETFLAARNEQGKPTREMLLLRETAPVELPADTYRASPGQKSLGACEFAAFGKHGARAAAAHATASRTALAALGH